MPTVVAESVADVDSVFENAVTKLRECLARRHAEIDRGAAGSRWLRLDDSDGKVFDRDAIGDATKRKALNDKLIRAQTGTPAESDADDATAKIGAVGDQIALSLQIDMLATLERARRQQTMTPVRARILSASRQLGHSGTLGVWAKGWVGHISDLVKRSKTGA